MLPAMADHDGGYCSLLAGIVLLQEQRMVDNAGNNHRSR